LRVKALDCEPPIAIPARTQSVCAKSCFTFISLCMVEFARSNDRHAQMRPGCAGAFEFFQSGVCLPTAPRCRSPEDFGTPPGSSARTLHGFLSKQQKRLGDEAKSAYRALIEAVTAARHRRLTLARANSSLSSTERRGANLDREFLAVSKLKPPRSLCPECDANRTCRVFEIHPSHSENDWKETRVPCDKFRGFDYASLCIRRKSFRLRLPLILFGFAREAFRALGNPRRDGSIFRPPFRMRSVLVFDESRHEH